MLIDKPRLPLKDVLLHGWWPSPLKKFWYRLKGYRIGRGVSLGFGAVIDGKEVELGDHTRIGFLSFIRCKSVRLGAYVQIGATTMIDTPHVEIGAGTRINEQVFIGGLQFPDSKLVIGRNCQIMQMTFINPARTITIGDDTGIGGHCLVFGHTSWLSAFEGYSVDFDSIEIGNSVSLAWRVFVLPGTRIGDGSVVGANSLVKGMIPPRCLAVGFPARVVSSATEFPRRLGAEEKQTLLDEILDEMRAYLESNGFKCRPDLAGYRITDERPGWRRKRHWRLMVQRHAEVAGAVSVVQGADVYLSLGEIPQALRQSLGARGVMWIDIERKERSEDGNDLGEEVAQYLRRYGVRFHRVPSPRA